MSYLQDVHPLPTPELGIPLSSAIVKVSVIDTTTRISGIPADVCVEPRIGAFTTLTCPAFSFLVEHEGKGQKVLYDLGVPKNWEVVFPEPGMGVVSPREVPG
jgi:hypothetical protein